MIETQENIKQLKQQIAQLKKERDSFKENSSYHNELSKTKDRFLASVSHEIRTPLNIILGCADLMSDLEGDIIKKQLDVYLSKIQSASAHLNSLIEDILNISLIENNQLVATPTSFNLKGFFNELVDELSIVATKGKNKLKLYCDETADVNFITDKKFLRQIVSNLVSNSFKYSGVQDCSVAVSIDDGSLNVVVRDLGAGMSPDDLSRVFEPFYQVQSPETISRTGVGLGLSLVNMLVKQLDGRIKINSAIGKGTQLDIELPQLKVNKDSVHEKVLLDKADLSVLSGKSLLVVEDDPDNRFVFEKFFSKSGADVSFAEDGLEGWDKFLEHHKTLDLVLIDLRMPRLSGLELIERIRGWETENGQKPIPALCLSANVSKNDQQEALSKGFRAFIQKPVSKVDLLNASALAVCNK